MAIPLKFINVIVPISVIRKKYPGGWKQCLCDYANQISRGYIWFDECLFRDGAMYSTGKQSLVDKWSKLGFDKMKDICVVDLMSGDSTLQCDWLVVDSNQRIAYLKGTEPDISPKPPRFKIIFTTYNKKKIIEILKDGEPFFEDLPGAKDHFSFGIEKLKMLITCFDMIRQFDANDGYLSDKYIKKPIESDKCEKTCQIFLKKYRGIPYLEIEDITPQEPERKLRFGRMKADAIVSLFS